MGADPPVYRDRRLEGGGVLRALVEVLADQAAVARRSIDRLWEDQFIDLCDDWAVPYLGDLVGTRMVSALDNRGRRVDVANTIYYRRRAGTLAVLEGLTADRHRLGGHGRRGVPSSGTPSARSRPESAERGRITGTPAHGLPTCVARVAPSSRGGRGTSTPTCPTCATTPAGWTAGTVSPSSRSTCSGWRVRRPHATPHLLARRRQRRPALHLRPVRPHHPAVPTTADRAFDPEWRAALEWELPARIRCEVLGNAEVRGHRGARPWMAQRGRDHRGGGRHVADHPGVRLPSESRFRARLSALFDRAGRGAVHRVLADALVADCGKGVLLRIATATARRHVIGGSRGGGGWRPQPVPRELTRRATSGPRCPIPDPTPVSSSTRKMVFGDSTTGLLPRDWP